MGLYSLTAVEFMNRIVATLAVSLPTVRFLQGPTIAELAAELGPMLESVAPSAAAVTGLDAVTVERVDELTDSEVDAALRELLEGGAVL
jgi:hypothetical protein